MVSAKNSSPEGSAGFGGMTDRRKTGRFPVREEVKYTVKHSRTRRSSGTGKTVDFGSGGILFTTEDRLPVGCAVELSVNWPALLGGKCPLQFVAAGRVVRAENNQAAVHIERYEFRTRGVEPLPLRYRICLKRRGAGLAGENAE